MTTKNPLAVVFGCAGAELGADEARFFRGANPLGFILFARNCVDPAQVTKLVADLREAVQRADAPVMIDQEGGRVTRLKPPHWPAYPAARAFGDAAGSDRAAALEAVRLNSTLIGLDLIALGITLNCAPTIDVPIPGAHEMIGSRAYGTDPLLVTEMGQAVCEGYLDANVMPVIKHLPGYGRAMVDSHLALPVIAESVEQLDTSDFVPFKALAQMPWGMTAHALLTAVDPDRPSTLSAPVVEQIIRKRIGFAGILVTDDVSMKALAGTVRDRAAQSLAAGCDVVLHCNGDMAEMQAIAEMTPPLSDALMEKIEAAERMRAARPRASIDPVRARQRIAEVLALA